MLSFCLFVKSTAMLAGTLPVKWCTAAPTLVTRAWLAEIAVQGKHSVCQKQRIAYII